MSDEEWDSFIGDKRKNIKRKYILIYLLGGHKDKESIILRFARSENLDIIDISEKQSFLSKDIYFDNRCTPEDFVYYIKNASLVITDSFHGIAFCIKFCVKAMVVDRIQSTSYSISDRVLSMLRAANLMSIFKKPDFTLDDLNSIYLNEQISNKENIERMLNTSKKFLKEFLTNV